MTVLVIMQQLVASGLFGRVFEWPAVPLLVLVNLGIIAAWYYFRKPDAKLPAFAVVIASFFFTIWLRAVMIYLGAARLVVPHVITFIERQITIIAAIFSMPLLIPAMLAALLLLMLMPSAKNVFGRFIYSEILMPPRTYQ